MDNNFIGDSVTVLYRGTVLKGKYVANTWHPDKGKVFIKLDNTEKNQKKLAKLAKILNKEKTMNMHEKIDQQTKRINDYMMELNHVIRILSMWNVKVANIQRIKDGVNAAVDELDDISRKIEAHSKKEA